ncbi:alanine racemase [Pseudosporangium ferrugineum]|uniref:D-serine deaminase-like pyridoxal phosphate-dependent protein n=1 Tax=Pseudosporangium ferrugineum TaxID=439699 RepID=A0A2T0S284_9ACTN|nr:alanine racemase [Pseudosporangium ferrugineum]PRY27537.1 D-serine deaminase-like pyridoxal phosphate-dependent protein [Pseudosporangium ferrugineum]
MILDIPDDLLDWRAKGFWLPEGEVPARMFAAARHSLFDGSFTWPLLVVRDSAVRANIATMAAYARRHGFSFAPHAKTTMAPTLLEAQLAAGAWGLTVATANQALVLRRLGVPRVLIANEVLDGTALGWLAAQAARGWEVTVQVDSVAGVEAVAAAGGLPVLIELGHPGGRTGCRTVAEVVAVAEAAASAPGVTLAGLTGYEGALPDAAAVDGFLATLIEATRAVARLLPPEVIVSAGGSAWFDRVIKALEGQWLDGHTVRALLRSGASVTHDEGFYRERTPFNREPGEGTLAPGLEMYAQVLSTPEPGLAIVGMGKRDAPFDEGLPVTSSGEVTKMNDHHTYVHSSGAAVGDVLRFGLSHPCTAFDKWRFIPVADDDDVVVDVLHTYF